MDKQRPFHPLALLCAGLLAGLAFAGLLLVAVPASQAQSGDGMGPGPAPTSWLRLPDLPETATVADRGAEIYRLVCQDCHGDRGQGLTPDWIAQWAPEDQNCWQSRCHATNHPPEGFILPRYVPPLIGETSLAQFDTALALQAFMAERMPWHAPGSLRPDEYWQLTAYVLRENGLPPVEAPFDPALAAAIRLHPESATAIPAQPTAVPAAADAPPRRATPSLVWPLAGLLVGALLLLLLWPRRRAG